MQNNIKHIYDFPSDIIMDLIRLNEVYYYPLLFKYPWIEVKYAMTLDGKMATKIYDSKWISNSESRKLVQEIRYRNDADLDLNVLFDVPKEKQEEERVRLSQQYLSAKNPNNIQGKLIPGSKHPINYYFITDQKTYDDQNKKADAVFDIETNKFIKRPDDFVFDPSLYVREFERKVQELDVVKGELKRDIIDYNELKELTPNDVLDLQEKIKDKLEEMKENIKERSR